MENKLFAANGILLQSHKWPNDLQPAADGGGAVTYFFFSVCGQDTRQPSWHIYEKPKETRPLSTVIGTEKNMYS